MCGIVGVAGDVLIKHEKAFAELLIMNQLRGFDSVGVARIGFQRTPEVLKTIDNPLPFVTSKPFQTLLKGANRVLIGHNRQATVGVVTAENAHPFSHDHITGVHNGTLTYRKNLEDSDQFTVDSDNLFYHIAKKGVHDLWTKMWGAASLVWWDTKTETLHFLRNKDRPMVLAFDKDRKVIMWASEYYMLKAAAARNAIVLDLTFNTDVNKLYTFNFGKGYSKGKVLEMTTEEIPTRPVQVFTCHQTYNPREGNDSGYEKARKPAWLFAGAVIDVIFEDRYETSISIRYEGFCPLDDRLNVSTVYHAKPTVEVINLKEKTALYRGTVQSVIMVYRKGFPEWEVKVGNVHRARLTTGKVKTLEDLEGEREAEEMALLLKEMEKRTETAPFDTDEKVACYANCPHRHSSICKDCRVAFKDREGTWEYNPDKLWYCDWCGTLHKDVDLVFVDKQREESYCIDCFPSVVSALSSKTTSH